MPNPPRKGQVPVGPNQFKEGELVEVTDSKEPWTEYHLADGSLLRFKAIVSEVWRITGEFDAEGNPVYTLKTQQVMNVIAPDNLKKPRA